MRRIPQTCLLLFAPLLFSLGSGAAADSLVRIKLHSPDALIDISGGATLNGQTLTGHLTGDGADIELTGLVKNRRVSVDLVGRIVPSCGLNRQSMNGIGDNKHEHTSIFLTLQCNTHSGGYGNGDSYQFWLDLILPPRPSYSPSSSPGESASLR
jgi:hypothetical protein